MRLFDLTRKFGNAAFDCMCTRFFTSRAVSFDQAKKEGAIHFISLWPAFRVIT